MAKRIVTKIGDVFCVDIDNQCKRYFQYIVNDMELKQQERPSIRKTLAVLKEKAAARSNQQAKEKIKERGLSR